MSGRKPAAVALASALMIAGLPAVAGAAQAAPPSDASSQSEPMRVPQLEALRASRRAELAGSAKRSEPMDFDRAPPAFIDAARLKDYESALQRQIRVRWSNPGVPQGATCRLYIRQLPGGMVVSTEVREPCQFDERARRSLEAAVLKAQPLAYRGFERMFERDMLMSFRADER